MLLSRCFWHDHNLIINQFIYGKSLIEDGYTLPERRKACRATDVPVSNAEYRRLRNLEKVDTACEVYADLDKSDEGNS